MLEYSITCADAVSESDLKLLSRCLDSIWEEETAAVGFPYASGNATLVIPAKAMR